ncbi:MAG: DNA methylase [Spirochaetaceae bacterium]|nr:DNA methylase [Spirochaetaceae bacterium]
MNRERIYAAIDLKSFYASVECVQRGLDPLTTRLVVADPQRGRNTICLAVTPGLKKYGLKGRCRMFQVLQIVREIEARTGKRLDYITAPPRMALYLQYSADIYQIYLKYFSPDDIHVYSIDEVFIDLTSYLPLYKTDAQSLCRQVIRDVLETTGITATVGIGTNLFLCKVAMDILAKQTAPDQWGVRMAVLDEMKFRRQLWDHRPLTDFWRIGHGIARRLEKNCIFTLGELAHRSLQPAGQRKLYRMFGVDAEILIDHAWGYEPCTMAHIKAYRPENRSIVSGQVLHSPYSFQKARLVVQEMTELLALELAEQFLVASRFSLAVGYEACRTSPAGERNCGDTAEYHGPMRIDHYGRLVPRSAHGTISTGEPTNLCSPILAGMMELYHKIVDPTLQVRRIHLCALDVVAKASVQPDLFSDSEAQRKEESLQSALLGIMGKFGKNSVVKAHDLVEGGTKLDRNCQLGGHRA